LKICSKKIKGQSEQGTDNIKNYKESLAIYGEIAENYQLLLEINKPLQH